MQEQEHGQSSGENHRHFAQGIVAPVAGQHGGDHVGDADFLGGLGDIAGGHVLVDRSVGVAQMRHIQRAIDERTAGQEADAEAAPRVVGVGLLSRSGQGERGQEENRRQAGPHRRFGESHINCVERGKDTGREQTEDAGEHYRGKKVPHLGNGHGDNGEERHQRDVN